MKRKRERAKNDKQTNITAAAAASNEDVLQNEKNYFCFHRRNAPEQKRERERVVYEVNCEIKKLL